MLEYKKKMRGSAEDVYYCIIDAMVSDIYRYTGKDISHEQFEQGYKYKITPRGAKKGQTATINIKQPIPNKKLTSFYSFGGMTTEMIYNINSIDETHSEVHFTQNQGKTDPFHKLIFNFKMWRFLSYIQDLVRCRRNERKQEEKKKAKDGNNQS